MFSKIFDISTPDRRVLHQEAIKILQELYASTTVPYTCPRCDRRHNPGTRLHRLHKQFVVSQVPYQKVNVPLPLDKIDTEIVGSYYTGNQDLLSQLPPHANMTLKPEPDNPHNSQAVSVWHQNDKLGYIPRAQNPPIFQALQNQVEPLTFFKGVSRTTSRKSKYPNNRWTLQVFVLNQEKANQIIMGMQELEVLGYSSAWDILADLSKEELSLMKAYIQAQKSSSHTNLISRLDNHLLKAPSFHASRLELYEPKVELHSHDEDEYKDDFLDIIY